MARDTLERAWSAVERARAKALLAEREASARQLAELLERVIETLPDPVWLKDIDGRWRLLNSAAAHVLGQPRVVCRAFSPGLSHAVL